MQFAKEQRTLDVAAGLKMIAASLQFFPLQLQSNRLVNLGISISRFESVPDTRDILCFFMLPFSDDDEEGDAGCCSFSCNALVGCFTSGGWGVHNK